MPINRDLNVDPYFDDYNLEKQFYRVLFKPSYAVQARELTQLQTVLQNQIEQFGDHIFKEGSIIKGVNFTELDTLKYVKVTNTGGFDPTSYVGFQDTITIGATTYKRDNSYELRGTVSGVKARVVAATRGFETRNPDLNTFYIDYTNTSSGNKVFQSGELLNVYKISEYEVGSTTNRSETLSATINVTTFSGATGNSYGLRTSPGIIYQKGHFLYAEEQLVIISKYTNSPTDVSVGFIVQENVINAFQDASLYDNANGSSNQNAPGADRLKLVPVLTAKTTSEADADTTFFTLKKYSNGNAILVRDVAQYHVLGEEMARRTYEESGDYVVEDFKTKVIKRDSSLKAAVGKGIAYVKGYRVENRAELFLDVDDIANTSVGERTNQAVSFNYGSYLNIIAPSTGSAVGTVDISDFSTVTLKDEASSAAGTARVRNVTDSKIFLFDIRLNSGSKIKDIEEISGTDGSLFVANNSIIQDASLGAMIFDTGQIGIKTTSNLSIPVRAQKALTGQSGTSVTISPAAGEDFGLTNDDILYVDDNNQKINVSSTSIVGSDLVLSLGASTTAAADVYYNKRITSATPFTKASADLYVKVTFAAADATGPAKYNLGFPDVYEITSITDSGGADVKNSFRLRTNQRDNYYDHSYIEYIPGRPIPADGLMTVRMNAFKLNDTTGDYFFTVDSYPTSVAKNKVPLFTSQSGKTFNPLDCLDFRPYVEPVAGATYTNAAVVGTAPTVSSAATGVNLAPSFSASYEILTPALNQYAQIDYEYYLGRTDIVTVDTYGSIQIVKGAEAENPIPPRITGDQFKIAEIFIPGQTALSPDEAQQSGQERYSVKIVPKGIKRYRMKDLENIERKIDALKYYVLLSALESETQNLNITDENGLSRFKNGIIVDPFNDLSIANLKDAEYKAAIDFAERSLTPAVKAYPLKLKYSTSSNASIFPSTLNAKVATLSRNTDISIISQPYATEFRNCVSNFYNYRGVGVLSPEYDNAPDTIGDPLNIDIDLVTPFQEFAAAIQEFQPMTSFDPSQSSVFNVTNQGRTEITTWSDQVTFLEPTGEVRNTAAVGDFVTNTRFLPYMRARDVNVYMGGLRPNTVHYFFFDGVAVDSYITPGTETNDPDSIQRYGSAGDTITSDANGIIRAVFSLPAETFYIGDRRLEITDVNLYSSIDSAATSYGEVTYRAYNFSVEKSSLTRTTRTPESMTTTRTVTNRTTTRRTGGKDPIAQTFYIKKGMGLGSDTVFASKLDVYFKRKSTVNGVNVELREVINGYPSSYVIPFSKVQLSPAQVNTSDDASIATTISFKAPVRLDVEKEYAFVVMPAGSDPDYLIFTSKVGGTNLVPGDNFGSGVIQDWGDGVLFTSTNGTAWYSYQDEDVKFNLYRHNFSASSGSVTLINDDHEFLTIGTTNGTFNSGEMVYKLETKDAATSATLSVVTGNTYLTGTAVSSTYSAGDYVLLNDGSTNKQIFNIVSSNSTVAIADRPAAFTDSVTATPVTIGNLVHYDRKYPDFFILEKSSANATRKFAASDDIIGFDSTANAAITSVDNINFSYMQPFVNRTNDSVTRTPSITGEFVDPAVTTNTYTKDLAFGENATFSRKGMVVFSKSNDVTRDKGFKFTVSMTNGGNVTSSPFVDIETANVLAYQYDITNVSSTTSKYISKTVELVENLDAEDLQVYVTAYRPVGTDVKVFIKPQAADDPATFETNSWIELEITQGVNQYSSVSNLNDFREFVYAVPSSAKTNGVITYTNDIGTFDAYRRFAIKIELHSENIYKAPRLLDYRGIALT